MKAVNPKTHVWIYRNLVKALSWYSDVGAKLADPAYSGALPPCCLPTPLPPSPLGPLMPPVPMASVLLRRVVPQVQERFEGQLLLGPMHRRQVQRPLPLAGSDPGKDHPPLGNLLQRAQQQRLGRCRSTAPGGKSAWRSATARCPAASTSTYAPPASRHVERHGSSRLLDGSAQLWGAQDHRNASLREWLVKEHVMGASSGGTDGLSNPNVTGFCKIAILSRCVRCPSR